jgi:7-carboxy-7-deazaguanine synthase
MDLRVNEFFGPTFQGEGPFAGTRCHFLRLNRCNLHCHWCDTPYTWADTEAKAALHDSGKVYPRIDNESVMSTDTVNALIRHEAVEFLVISGGEPLLQAQALNELIENMDGNITVQFETAGTLPPLDQWTPGDGVHYVVSPKLDNSGNQWKKRYKPDVLKEFAGKDVNADFKFVVTGVESLDEVCKIQKDIGINPEKVWIMPEGITADKILDTAKAIAEPVLEAGFNLTLRTHTLLWGDERGR